MTTSAERTIGVSAGQLLQLVRTGAATSRSDLTRLSGLAASTVSLRVNQLIEHGYLREDGSDASRGGRRPRRLRIDDLGGEARIATAELGAHHARLGVADFSGKLIRTEDVPIRISDGPQVVLSDLYRQIATLADREPGKRGALRALSLAIPAPVDYATGQIVLPSRMPGWHMTDVRAELRRHTNIPVLVDNDANLMALGEYASHGSNAEHLLVAKIGSGIGLGIVSAGRVHRGTRGGAGDVSHVAVDGKSVLPCTCGNTSCLESVASGGAVVELLRQQGLSVANPLEVVELARNGNVAATDALREAGHTIGTMLAIVVDFFNPDTLALGGALAAAEPLVAAVRSVLYERCLPLSSETITVKTCATGLDAALQGGVQLALDHVLGSDEVDRRLATQQA